MNATAQKERRVFLVLISETPKSTDISQSPVYLA